MRFGLSKKNWMTKKIYIVWSLKELLIRCTNKSLKILKKNDKKIIPYNYELWNMMKLKTSLNLLESKTFTVSFEKLSPIFLKNVEIH